MNARARPATLEQVASVAGVSRATVSRVVNGNPRVSDEVRRAVSAAIDELGYAPNRAARSLVTRRADSIGLVVAESEQRVFGEPFFATLIRGVSAALAGTEMQLVLLLTRADEDQARLRRFLSTHVDGVLLVSAHADDPLLDELTSTGVPAVLAGRPLTSTRLPYVDADNVGGARLAVDHLLSTGRTTIGHITGTLDLAPGLDRSAGYRAALADAGVAAPDSLTVVGDFTAVAGERGAAELLARHPDLDAIFAASDLMAIGAIRALEAAGRHVPDDVAVIGFDDSVLAETSTPPLTTVHQPVEDIGRQLIARLRDAIDGSRAVPSATILPTDLVIRASA